MASYFVEKFNPKKTMILSALAFPIWISCFTMTTVQDLSPQMRDAVYAIAIFGSFFAGIGGGCLFVAQGKYMSDCALSCEDKKGLYTSIFCLFFTVICVCFDLSSSISKLGMGLSRESAKSCTTACSLSNSFLNN